VKLLVPISTLPAETLSFGFNYLEFLLAVLFLLMIQFHCLRISFLISEAIGIQSQPHQQGRKGELAYNEMNW
jgi:hypothetical protein